MDTNHIPSDEPQTSLTNKKPYEKPSFRHEQVFVTTAISCGKAGSVGQCMGSNKS